MALNERRPETGSREPAQRRAGGPGAAGDRGGVGADRPPADVPAIYRLAARRQPLGPGPPRGGLGRERAGGRARPRLAEHATRTPTAGGTAPRRKYRDGTVVEGDDDYTVHCPPGDICFGECFYWEADTALTGLALLAYLGAGYTHTDGKYAETVAKGLEFLPPRRRSPTATSAAEPGRRHVLPRDGHAGPVRGLCPDRRQQAPHAGRAGRRASWSSARARTAWPGGIRRGAAVGDTSILGWVVMALKSAKEVGIPIPRDDAGRARSPGSSKVSGGPAKRPGAVPAVGRR